eukprot:CAMPEP_0185022384 /NCGR_PEP_ID=MMETSP1103-20130426/5105_1 /TAXON_ID=36769 /ORGANISM="Paraphysomonas bandaiensis, Strain Caron Lab Isolate" /LENGTH=550 /DNA_ID=CAMNT_0027554431 /DNA_START=131 /DNA_END=1783 /DNA_ORIENTATION=+
MHYHLSDKFDSVATVALFSCIIAVTGEDISLGPVIYKSIYRSLGVCLGGLCGFVLLCIPVYLLPNYKGECLLVIPTVFVAAVQWFTKGGSAYLTSLIKRRKAGHLVLQVQMAFGVIYLGSWEQPSNGLIKALWRTIAILIAAISLLLATLLALPQTSMHASAQDLSACLHSVGAWMDAVCRQRAIGETLPRYDHRGKVFGAMSTIDPHMEMLDSIDAKITRVVSLQPFLRMEPSWVPMLPRSLLWKESVFPHHWGPFYAVISSRLSRLRATLTSMDANMRIDSRNRAERSFKNNVANSLLALATTVKVSLGVIALYVESPYLIVSTETRIPSGGFGWKGDMSLSSVVANSLQEVKACMRNFIRCVDEEVYLTNSVRHIKVMKAVSDGDIAENEDEDDISSIWDDRAVEKTETSKLSPINQFSCDNNEPVTIPSPVPSPISFTEAMSVRRSYVEAETPTIDSQLGSETTQWLHRMRPIRSFCTMAVQCSVQCSSLLHETLIFMDSLPIENKPRTKACISWRSYGSQGPVRLESSSAQTECPDSDNDRRSFL